MVDLQFFKTKDLSELNYRLDEIQEQFTALPKLSLERIEERNQREDFTSYPVTIFYDALIVGFYVLDFGNDTIELTENSNAVLLRSLSVNPEFQGKGIGKSAMMGADDFIRMHFKNCHEIVLTVNERNTLAFQIYLNTGYVFEGKKIAGRNGPQLVMSKILK